jgi:hypothetical protein
MQRVASIAAALAVAFLLVTPVALAADPSPGGGQVLLAVRGDVTLTADQTADVIVVVQGTAHLAGAARTVVVVDGSAVLDGAHVDTLWAVRSTIELQPGSVVSGDVLTLDATVHRSGDADVQGSVTEITPALFALGAILAPAAILFWFGFGLATIVLGLFLAGLAGRQVRETELLIGHELVQVVLIGLASMIVVPTIAVLLMISILGAPLGLGILLLAWPLVAFLGYLVAGTWVGDWILARVEPGKVRERPYLAAATGLVVLQVVSLIPVVGLVSVIASLLGFGAVLLACWRTLRGQPGVPVAAPRPAPAPVAW